MYKEIINTSHKLSTKKYNKDMGNPKAFLTIPRQMMRIVILRYILNQQKQEPV